MRCYFLVLALLLAGCATPFDLQGHRGARGLAPENTLPAFEKALALGVTTLELDTGVTSDGVVVVAHDPYLNPDIVRGADGQWLARRGPNVSELTFEALSRYDVGRIKPGSTYAGDYPDQVAADGTRIPRLAEVFALAQRSGNRAVRFNIETKISPLAPHETLAPEPFARKVIEEIRKAGMASRATLQSFDWRTLVEARFLAPGLRRVALAQKATIYKGTPWTAGIAIGAKPFDDGSLALAVKDDLRAQVLSPNFADLTDRLIKSAHNRGLSVIPWTVNEKADMTALIGRGVDGIITDYPDRLRAVMAGKDMPLPPQMTAR